jgi:hypothetical protein
MILVLNVITTLEDVQRFDSILRDNIYPREEIETVYLGDKLPEAERFSHLIK